MILLVNSSKTIPVEKDAFIVLEEPLSNRGLVLDPAEKIHIIEGIARWKVSGNLCEGKRLHDLIVETCL